VPHKQRSIFETIPDIFVPEPKVHERVLWRMALDGASKGNPGPAGAGIFIKKDNQVYAQKGFFLGTKTNNEAEYLALVIGLLLLKKELQQEDTLQIVSDSELMIKQMNKEYRVKKPELKKLFDLAQLTLHSVSYTCSHVLREYNQEADRLANLGVEKKTPLPLTILDVLQHHEIILF
jgi:ribonuclease HI